MKSSFFFIVLLLPAHTFPHISNVLKPYDNLSLSYQHSSLSLGPPLSHPFSSISQVKSARKKWKLWWHNKLHLLHNILKKFKKCLPLSHLPARETFLSVLWLCTSYCLAMSPWQPPVSSLGDTFCVQSAVQSLPGTFSAPRECIWVFVCCVLSDHVWRAPYLWALEIHIVCLSHTHALNHTQCHVYSQIRATAESCLKSGLRIRPY